MRNQVFGPATVGDDWTVEQEGENERGRPGIGAISSVVLMGQTFSDNCT